MELIKDSRSDVVFFTETWLQTENSSVTAQICEHGYTLKHKIRNGGDKVRGGGVGIMLKSGISANILASADCSSFEHLIVKLPIIKPHRKEVLLICIYRLQTVHFDTFFEEFSELLNIHVIKNNFVVIAGDFNLHIDMPDRQSEKFFEILSLYGLKQHMDKPTHNLGHTLDLLITNSNSRLVKDITISNSDISDHFLINFNLTLTTVLSYSKVLSYRNIKNIDNTEFRNQISSAFNSQINFSSVNDIVNWYNHSCLKVVDSHAPLLQKMIKVKQNAPWFDGEYAALRRQRRKAERKFRRTGNNIYKEEIVKLKKAALELSLQKKKMFISKKLEGNSSKSLYNVVKTLLNTHVSIQYPKCSSDTELANKFMEYFQTKIDKIRSTFQNHPPTSIEVQQTTSFNLSEFRQTNQEEIKSVVSSHPIKCSPDDPVHVQLISMNLDLFIPVWTEIVNLSLKTGSMECLKSAIITPILKEGSEPIDTDDFSHFRPISNLLFISKLIERIVAIRIEEHMVHYQLHKNKQYGYKLFHSTETLLMKVVNDLLMACDKNIPTVLILLDLSAAFDTVDHCKLLFFLEQDIGVSGTALKWFNSYLTGRTVRVKINAALSYEYILRYGVPQGSVLGPILFSIYMRGFYDSVDTTKFNVDGFADDHQLFKNFLISMQVSALGDNIRQLMNCISLWMKEHFLKLNQNKTKIIIIAPPPIFNSVTVHGVFLQTNCVRFVNSAKNLGIELDNFLTFDNRINKLAKSCYLNLKNFSSIKTFLNQDHLKTLMSTKILSTLDYCNSLYYGVSSKNAKLLQHIQNSALRVAYKGSIPRNSSLDSYFRQLHWLKVKDRIIYKIVLIVHKCLLNHAPDEITNLVQYSNSERSMKLRELRAETTFGERSFSVAGPKLWNLLPAYIRHEQSTEKFKKLLKSHLMNNY